ncbi:MAG: hypothetical protein WCL39_08020, partial [Armatimonadota bacterium]
MALVPYDGQTMDFACTPAQAIASAHAWSGVPIADLVFLGVDGRLAGDDPRPYYRVETTDGSQTFNANVNSGAIDAWALPSVRRAHTIRSAQEASAPMLPTAELRTRIEAFLTLKQPGFSTSTYQLVFPEDVTSHYVQRLPSGVWVAWNQCVAGIDRWTGDIYAFKGLNGPPVSVSQTPSLTFEQAAEVALASFEADETVGAAFVHDNWGLWAVEDDLGAQRLFWSLEVIVSSDPDYTAALYDSELESAGGMPTGSSVELHIDAHNGDVILRSTYSTLGSSAKSKTNLPMLRRTFARKSQQSASTEIIVKELQRNGLSVDGKPLKDMLFPPRIVSGRAYIYNGYIAKLFGPSTKQVNGHRATSSATKPPTVAAPIALK